MNRPKNWNPNNTNNPMVKCATCSTEFKRTHNRMAYCEKCAKPKYGSRSVVNDGEGIHKICEECHDPYVTKARAQKFCFTCMPIKKAERNKAYKEDNKKGYSQEGDSNNNWKGGIGVYTKLAFEVYGMSKICNRCGSEKHILVHHINLDRYNNDRSNLEILCKSCHQKEHEAGINLHPDSPVFKSNKV